MAVIADESYEIKEGIYCSCPVQYKGNGKFEIAKGSNIDDFNNKY